MQHGAGVSPDPNDLQLQHDAHADESETAALVGDKVVVERETASTAATFFIFLKSYLGSGIMGMASAYLSGGVIPVTLLIYAVAVLSCVCFVMVFRVRDHVLATRDIGVQDLTFERVVEEVLGPWGKRSVVAALLFTQCGFATAYVIFIANNLQLLYPVLRFEVYALLMVPPLIVLCWLKFKWIYPVALAGIGAIWLAVVTVLYYCIKDELIVHGVSGSAITRVNWATLPVAFGVVVYLFEGVGLILPLESKMRHRVHFPLVMWGVHLSVATVVAAFGLVGFLSFVEGTCGPIIKNLPGSGWLVVLTVWGLNVCLLFTYPVQMLPVFQIAEDALFECRPHSCGGARRRSCNVGGVRGGKRTLALRALIVCGSVAVGIAIPYFELFLSLIGGLGSAQLMFILPPITYYVAFRSSMSLRAKIGCALLLAFGVATLVVTTVFTLIELANKFQHPAATPCGSASANATVIKLVEL